MPKAKELTTAQTWAMKKVGELLPGLVDEPTRIAVACSAVKHVVVPGNFTPEALVAAHLQDLDGNRRRLGLPRFTAQEWAQQREWTLRTWKGVSCE